MYLTDKTLVNLIQTNLNTISESLYDDTTISNKIVFYVTNNVATYDDRVEMEFKANDDILYTPVLMQRVASTMIDDHVQGTYQEGYTLEILAYDKDKEDIEKIFNQYVYEENLNDSKQVGVWTILKTNTSRLQFVQTYSNPNENIQKEYKKRISYILSFTWEYILGGIKDESSTFTIDGSAIDVIGVSYVSDKLSIANIAYGSNVKPIGATGFTLSLTIPAQNITANKNLFTDLTNKSYNKKYTIAWTIDNFHSVSYDMILRSGTVNYQRDQLISYTVTFEEALPRTTVTIDGVSLPVLSMSFYRQSKIDGNAHDYEYKVTPKESAYELRMKIAYDSTTAKSIELLQAILNADYMLNTYTVVISVAGGVSKTYTVHLIDGTYAFEQTAELIYDCTFAEVDANGI